jgi:hypothetical protein
LADARRFEARVAQMLVPERSAEAEAMKTLQHVSPLI